MTQYQAVNPIGRFNKGDMVGGLTDTEIEQHLAAGNIKAVKDAVTENKSAKATGEKTNG